MDYNTAKTVSFVCVRRGNWFWGWDEHSYKIFLSCTQRELVFYLG